MRLLLSLSLLLIIGCGPTVDLSSPTAQRLQSLAVVYLDYAGAKGSGPVDEQQLFRHIVNVSPALLPITELNADTASRYFVSERDGKPFVVRYGLSVHGQQNLALLPIAHEQQGQDGELLAMFANGEIRLVGAESLPPQSE
jgi:hypothetical protein